MSGHLSGLSRKTQTAPSVYTGRTGGLGEGGAEVGETEAALDLHQLPRPPHLVSPALGIAPAVGPAHAKGLMEEEGRGAGALTVKGERPEQRQGPGCGSLISWQESGLDPWRRDTALLQPVSEPPSSSESHTPGPHL